MILTSGIKKVIYLNSYAEYKGHGIEEGINFLQQFGVDVRRFRREDVLIGG
jgi:dCMP deaminase